MIRDIFDRLNFPQALCVVAIVAGAVSCIIFVPPEFWQHVDWQWCASFALSAFGIGGSVFLPKLIHSHPVRGPHSVRPPAPPVDPDDEYHDEESPVQP